MSQIRTTCLAISLVAILLPSSTFASIVVTDGRIDVAVAQVQPRVIDLDSFVGPSSGSATATIPDYLSQTTRVIDSIGVTTEISFQRAGRLHDQAQMHSTVSFTSLISQPFSISGGLTNTFGATSLSIALYDVDLNNYVFRTVQRHFATEAFTAVVGIGGANEFDLLEGSLIGSLTAGHRYVWSIGAQTDSGDVEDNGATSSGTVQLQIGTTPQTEVVPEPASIAVWSCLGLTAIGSTWWRKRRSI